MAIADKRKNSLNILKRKFFDIENISWHSLKAFDIQLTKSAAAQLRGPLRPTILQAD
jgi:hypothetical protein